MKGSVFVLPSEDCCGCPFEDWPRYLYIRKMIPRQKLKAAIAPIAIPPIAPCEMAECGTGLVGEWLVGEWLDCGVDVKVLPGDEVLVEDNTVQAPFQEATQLFVDPIIKLSVGPIVVGAVSEGVLGPGA
jgi:hypothetical protein